MSEQTPEKKLYVDEDWKSQVEAEKAAEKAAEVGQPAAPQGNRGPMPPADLAFLVSSLYLEGALALGLIPNPSNQKPEVHLDQAQHAIDLLTMLEQKTQGNRTPEESEDLEAALHQLRLAYVEIRERAAGDKKISS